MDSYGAVFSFLFFLKSRFNMLQTCQLLFCYPVNNKNGLTLRLCNVPTRRVLKDSKVPWLSLQATLQTAVFPRISSKAYSQSTTRTWIKQPPICVLWLLGQKNSCLAVQGTFRTCSSFYMWTGVYIWDKIFL